VAPPANAGIADSVGLSPRAVALGGSYAARPGDSAATWYNPAGLAPGPYAGGSLELSLGAVYARPAVFATQDDGADLALAAPVPDVSGLLLGVRAVPADQERPFAFGVALYLPRRLFSWHIHPDDAPQWALLTERAQYVSLQAAVAWQPTPWLAFGAGFDAVFDVHTDTRAQVTGFEQEDDAETGETRINVRTRMGEDLDLTGRIAPVLGLLTRLSDDACLGLSWRGETGGEDYGKTIIAGVPGMGNLGYPHHFVHFYRPDELTAALAWRADAALTLSADLTWARWSAGRTINERTPGPGRFGDTLVTALGISWQTTGGIELLAGYRWVPAPFDNFGGPTNLLVTTQHVGSLGVSLDLGWLAGFGEPPLRLDLALQAPWLVERREEKDWRRFTSDGALEANPGYPGYRFGGLAPAGMLALETAW